MEIQLQLKMKQLTKFLPFSELQHHWFQLIKFIVAALALTINTTAYAAVNSVKPTPSSVSISPTNIGATTINVTWHVNRTELLAPVLRTVISPTASLQLNGSTIATVGGTTSKTSLLALAQSATLSFNESFIISAALARKIADSPPGSLKIIRTFTDDNQIFITGAIPLSSGAGNSGSLAVHRIDLSFENQARTDVVYKNEQIRAVVDISFRNNGILKGEWRLIDPTSSLGNVGGRVLRVVRKNLISSGQGRTRIVSPPLPTNENGLYLLAFAVDSSDSNLETPVLRYFVIDENTNQHAVKLSNITTLSPRNLAELSSETVFSWHKIEGAQAYQVELFNKEDDVPITGKLTPASISQLSLSSFSREQLIAGYEYSWQVKAFDSNGNVVGKSEPKVLLIQE